MEDSHEPVLILFLVKWDKISTGDIYQLFHTIIFLRGGTKLFTIVTTELVYGLMQI